MVAINHPLTVTPLARLRGARLDVDYDRALTDQARDRMRGQVDDLGALVAGPRAVVRGHAPNQPRQGSPVAQLLLWRRSRPPDEGSVGIRGPSVA